VALTAASSPVCFTLAEFEHALPAERFVAELARRATPSHLMSSRWPVLAFERSSPQLWTPGDPASVVGSATEVSDTDGDFPADVLVVDAASSGGPTRGPSDHHVIGPLADDVPLWSAMEWSQYHRLGPRAADRQLERDRGLGLGPLDAQVLNPVGFLREPTAPRACLDPGDLPWQCRVQTPDRTVVVDTRRGVGEGDVARLRCLEAVRVPWRGAEGPRQYCRLVAALAMAGVPLVAGPLPSWARTLLHPALAAALEEVTDTAEPMAREISSIRLRRAALWHHGAVAWRRRLAAAASLQPVAELRVSILLPSRRPDMLAFALRQVGRQRGVDTEGVDMEVVLATHGYEPDPGLLDRFRDESDVRLVALSAPAEQPFGAVLNTAAARAGGDVLLKMDDDDWYGPDFVADLLLARDYSGADVVGCAPEFAYLEPLATTVRRRSPTESYAAAVAGGTMLVSRHAFDSVGGFRRMRRYVDAGILRAVSAAGGSVYRSHGHGYVLRRRDHGHTWDPGLDFFLRRRRTTRRWGGFRPSPLLEPDPVDAPDLAPPARSR
jgi:hypothetical protein